MRHYGSQLTERQIRQAAAGAVSDVAVRRGSVRSRKVRSPHRCDGTTLIGVIAGHLPILVYYAASIACLAVSHGLYAHRVFLAAGPLTLVPGEWPSFCAACIVVLISASAGRLFLAVEGKDVTDALLAASLGMAASIGAYSLCYTLHNPIMRFAVAVSAASTAIYAVRDKDELLYSRVVRPLWFQLAALGFITAALWGWATSAARIDLQYPEAAEERCLAEHIEAAALCFDEGAWKSMSLDEKADALGEIVLVECNYLGVEEPPSIMIGACPGGVVACYSDKDNLITFNTSYLATGSDGGMAVEAAAHETAHCYQAECVKRGYALPAAESGWPPDATDKRTVERWALEFEDYVPSTVDSKRYSEQDCERTAYRYGLASRQDIEDRVKKYLETGNPYA